MQRKTMLISALTATALVAGVVFAGTALGADWHEYKGKVTAGQVYVVPVPEDAETLSFALAPSGENAVAQLVVYDANDARVGYGNLDKGTQAWDLVDPLQGGYVVFVHELRNAELSVRVQTKNAGELNILKAETTRTDKPIVRDFEGSNLSREISINVKENPLFATVLYKGQVDNLQATVASPLGEVMRVTGETGTSYSPGIGIGTSGTRQANLDNLAPGTFTVKATADRLDGSLYLTLLSYVRPVVPVPIPIENDDDDPDASEPSKANDRGHKHERQARHAKAERAEPSKSADPQGAPLPPGIPVAVDVTDTRLALALPMFFCTPPEEEEEESNSREQPTGTCKFENSYGSSDYWSPSDPWDDQEYAHGNPGCVVVSVYDPHDELVGVFNLGPDEPFVILDDLAAGEHVLFVQGPPASEDAAAEEPAALLVKPDAPEEEIAYRFVSLVANELSVSHAAILGGFEPTEIEMETPPLNVWSYVTDDTVAADYRATLDGPAGNALAQNSPLIATGWTPDWWSYESTDPTVLVKGTYAFAVSTLASTGATILGYVTYDRGTEWAADVVVAEDADNEGEGTSATPLAPPALRSVPALPALPSLPRVG